MGVLGVIASVVIQQLVTLLAINHCTFFEDKDGAGLIGIFVHCHLCVFRRSCFSRTHVPAAHLTFEAIELANGGLVDFDGEYGIVVIINSSIDTHVRLILTFVAPRLIDQSRVDIIHAG